MSREEVVNYMGKFNNNVNKNQIKSVTFKKNVNEVAKDDSILNLLKELGTVAKKVFPGLSILLFFKHAKFAN